MSLLRDGCVCFSGWPRENCTGVIDSRIALFRLFSTFFSAPVRLFGGFGYYEYV
jgi:hypothetical protein